MLEIPRRSAGVLTNVRGGNTMLMSSLLGTIGDPNRSVPVSQHPRVVPVPLNLSARNTLSLAVLFLSELNPSFLVSPIPNMLLTYAEPSYVLLNFFKIYLEKKIVISMGMGTYLSAGTV